MRESNHRRRLIKTVLSLATRQAVHVLERVVGLEPTLSRWQRAVLATGRYPHGLRERTRTPANDVRSVGARPWDAEVLLRLERATGVEPV